MTPYRIKRTKTADKFIRKQPPKRQQQLLVAIRKLPHTGDIIPLEGHKGVFRLRVGGYRVLFTVDHGVLTVYVIDADNRGDAY